jgi:hypothetical protein
MFKKEGPETHTAKSFGDKKRREYDFYVKVA